MFLNDEQLDTILDVFGLRNHCVYNVFTDEMLFGIDVHTHVIGWKNSVAYIEYSVSRDKDNNLVHVALDVRPTHGALRYVSGAIDIGVFLSECRTVLGLRAQIAQYEQVVKDAEATKAKAQAEIDKRNIILSYLEAAL